MKALSRGLILFISFAMLFAIQACSEFSNSELKLTNYKEAHLWPKGILVYQFDEGFYEDSKHLVQTAANNINNLTEIEIISLEDAKKKGYKIGYVAKVKPIDQGCSATPGYIETSTINLSPECPIGAIMHEFFHVLGIAHEQLNPNFEGNINLDRVKEGYERNFTGEYLGGLTKHDKLSIMHYHSWAFSICSYPDSEKVVASGNETLKRCSMNKEFYLSKECVRECAVITDSQGGFIYPQSDYLTEDDVKGINSLYKNEIK